MSSVASILNQLAIEAGVPLARISADDVNALHDLNDADAGIWIFGDDDFTSAMDKVAASIGAYFGFDHTGVMRMGQLNIPGGNAAAEINDYDVMDIVVRPDKDLGRPAWRTTLTYAKNYTVQQSDIAAIVSDARRAEIAQEWRRVSEEDEDIKDRCLLATEPEFQGLLAEEADAQAEVERRFAIYSVKKQVFDITTDISWLMNNPIEFMDVVRVTYGRLIPNGLGVFNVIGINMNLARSRATISLWG